MEDSVKKPIMIGIAVACLGLAVVITIMRSSYNPISDIGDEEVVQLKCNNKECDAESEMKLKDFAAYALKNSNINGAPNPMVCKQCGKESLVRAVKCEKCGTVFLYGAAGAGKLPDTCPKCDHSAEKEQRQAAR